MVIFEVIVNDLYDEYVDGTYIDIDRAISSINDTGLTIADDPNNFIYPGNWEDSNALLSTLLGVAR